MDKAAFIKVVEHKRFCKVMQKCVEVKCIAWEQISIASVPMLVLLLDLSFKFSISTLNCVKLIIPWK